MAARLLLLAAGMLPYAGATNAAGRTFLEAKAKADFAMIGDQRTNELYNGRLAMLAITGFAIQEGLWGSPVISQTPGFFGR